MHKVKTEVDALMVSFENALRVAATEWAHNICLDVAEEVTRLSNSWMGDTAKRSIASRKELPVGTTLDRRHKGSWYRVLRTKNCFKVSRKHDSAMWHLADVKTLTAAAIVITGRKVSGYEFFKKQLEALNVAV